MLSPPGLSHHVLTNAGRIGEEEPQMSCRIPRGALRVVLIAAIAGAHPAWAQDAAKGAVLLAAARTAIGGADKLAAIKRLQVSGTFLR